MGRLIEVDDPKSCHDRLTIRVGDVLLFRASGGRIRAGADVLELLGPFVPAVVGDDGEIFSPTAPPNTLLFRALRPGQAAIDVITGDPWHRPETTEITINVAR